MMDQNGRLRKQYVRTGRIFYGRIIEILDGITPEDAIAFPYGSAQEGAKTKMSEESGAMAY